MKGPNTDFLYQTRRDILRGFQRNKCKFSPRVNNHFDSTCNDYNHNIEQN